MKKPVIDTTLVDKAISFAAKAHSGIVRKGTNIPYIVHPMEAVAIVASITDDQELMAAAALHDVIEDTDTTMEDLEKEFGPRVARIVGEESQLPIQGMSKIESWKFRRQQAIEHLKEAPREAKIVAMADKLSNMRAIFRDFNALGNALWDRFNVNDPRLHKWYYESLLDSLSDLCDTESYKEFSFLVKSVFERLS